jgi:hypothetical protein
MIVRQPFMDVDFMQLICRLPHGWRKRHLFYLAVLKRFAPLSARAPYQRTMLPAAAPYWLSLGSLAFQRGLSAGPSWLGRAVLRGKLPSDFPSWFRGSLRGFVESLLLDERTLDRGVVPPDLVRLALSQHMDGGRDLSSFIGALISLEVFARLFFDDLENSLRRYNSNEPVTADRSHSP